MSREEELIQAFNRFRVLVGDVMTLPAYNDIYPRAEKLIDILKDANMQKYYDTAVLILDAAHTRATR
jgi:hypothetical protein